MEGGGLSRSLCDIGCLGLGSCFVGSKLILVVVVVVLGLGVVLSFSFLVAVVAVVADSDAVATGVSGTGVTDTIGVSGDAATVSAATVGSITPGDSIVVVDSVVNSVVDSDLQRRFLTGLPMSVI